MKTKETLKQKGYRSRTSKNSIRRKVRLTDGHKDFPHVKVGLNPVTRIITLVLNYYEQSVIELSKNNRNFCQVKRTITLTLLNQESFSVKCTLTFGNTKHHKTILNTKGVGSRDFLLWEGQEGS